MYKYLLIPGRHHAITSFQVEHVKALLQREDVAPDAMVVWAVTSANHVGTRRNPLSGSRRLGMIEAVSAVENLPSMTFRISARRTKSIAHYLLEEIHTQSRGRVDMTPENTLVVTSTKEVIDDYQNLGYTIDLAEADPSLAKRPLLPWEVIEEIVASGANWRTNQTVATSLHPECLVHYEHYHLGDDIVGLFDDSLIAGDDGDITLTRDYDKYQRAFEDGAARKLVDFAPYIKPGKILDVGCATGETIKLMSQIPDLFESDFYGVEVARPLYSICQQRKDRGDFGDTNVYFYQCNIMRETLFTEGYLDTVITMALTHEIESYMGRDELLRFLRRMYTILAPGGVYINYDVVAPEEKERKVYVQFTDTDGENPEDLFPLLSPEEHVPFVKSLSSKSRFLKFAKDFREKEGDQLTFATEIVAGEQYFTMRYADLCDFLAKKDYVESWYSEMHERFCFWEFDDWATALEEVGFEVGRESEPKQNKWLIENRFAPAANVFEMKDGKLTSVDHPVTNVLLVARKP